VKSGPALVLTLALAAVLVAACEQRDPEAPFTSDRMPPGLQSRFYPPDGWTWGLIEPGGVPAARYGVSAPDGEARADVLILASYGEPAEVWFETARELNAKGYVVWVLEEVGQGGSGRYSRLRDLGYAESLAPDVLAAKIMAGRVIHHRPLILMASGTSAPAAIQAVASGVPAEGLILTSPRLQPDDPATLARAHELERRNLGWLRADLHGGWSRHGQDDLALGLTHDPARGALRMDWQIANPELRMGSPTWSWITAFAQAAGAAGAAEPQVAAPVLVLQASSTPWPAQMDCKRMPRCTLQPVVGAGQALELESDRYRPAWQAQVSGFVEKTIAGFAPPSADGRVPAQGHG
jgi:lysophospholipase